MAIAGDTAIAGRLGVVNLRFQSNQGPDVEWKVRRVRLSESLSEPYLAVVDLVVADTTVDLMSLVGLSCDLEMDRDGGVRRVCGLVARVHYVGTMAGHLLARIHVVPAFHLLEQRANTRMFQEKSVPDILKAVLEEALGPYEREIRLSLRGSYDPREYCLQYGESDRTFVERLMQEEGIFYFFDHEGAKEVMVLLDANSACPPCAAGGAIPLITTDSGTGDVEAVREMIWVGEARTTSVALRDHDWTRPALNVEGKAPGADAQGRDREVYLYAANVTKGGYSGDKYTKTTVQAQATLRRQAETVRARRGTGKGFVTAFAPGCTFELSGHGVAGLDRKYLLVRVDHVAEAPDAYGNEHSSRDNRDPAYANSFECIPDDVPFRSPRTIPRPRIGGLQNAKVVGPAGEEIHTDSHGRIKVQFPWDRQAKGDDKSSCWVRVAQGWAGPGWGSLFIPRIGMEVLVAFIEGDLDRPIVVGCMFNGQNPPPYALPAEKTKSTIKTWSSPGGEGYNEIRFEDSKDKEELYLQAQKDMNILVKNDKSQEIDRNETLEVGGHRERTVHGNQALTVHRDDTSTINGNQSLTVNKNRDTMVLGRHEETVALSQSTNVGLARSLSVGGAMDVSVTGASSESVGGNRTEDVAKAYTLTVGKQSEIKIGDTLTVEVTKDIKITGKATFKQDIEKEATISADKIQLVAQKELSIKVGDASIVLKKNGDIVIKGGKISVEASGNLKLKGSKVADN